MVKQVRIERGTVLIPEKKQLGQPSGPVKRALEDMEVGDSFWLPIYNENKASQVHTIARRIGIRVVTRKMAKNGDAKIQGLRVWRIERP